MAPTRLNKSIYFGTFVHNVSLTEVEILENCAVGVDENGVITFVEKGIERGNVGQIAEGHGWTEWDLHIEGGKGTRFWFPGFIGMSRWFFVSSCSVLAYQVLSAVWEALRE